MNELGNLVIGRMHFCLNKHNAQQTEHFSIFIVAERKENDNHLLLKKLKVLSV